MVFGPPNVIPGILNWGMGLIGMNRPSSGVRAQVQQDQKVHQATRSVPNQSQPTKRISEKNAELTKELSKNGIKAHINKDKLQVSLQAGIHFEFDSTKLTPAGVKRLQEVTRILKTHDKSACAIKVTGRTCSMGEANYNQKLSEGRAKTVAEELDKQKAAPGGISYTGAGECKETGTKEIQRQQRINNRRVDIEFHIPALMEDIPQPPAAVNPAPAKKGGLFDFLGKPGPSVTSAGGAPRFGAPVIAGNSQAPKPVEEIPSTSLPSGPDAIKPRALGKADQPEIQGTIKSISTMKRHRKSSDLESLSSSDKDSLAKLEKWEKLGSEKLTIILNQRYDPVLELRIGQRLINNLNAVLNHQEISRARIAKNKPVPSYMDANNQTCERWAKLAKDLGDKKQAALARRLGTSYTDLQEVATALSKGELSSKTVRGIRENFSLYAAGIIPGELRADEICGRRRSSTRESKPVGIRDHYESIETACLNNAVGILPRLASTYVIRGQTIQAELNASKAYIAIADQNRYKEFLEYESLGKTKWTKKQSEEYQDWFNQVTKNGKDWQAYQAFAAIKVENFIRRTYKDGTLDRYSLAGAERSDPKV